MQDKVFVDTNVLIYSYSETEPDKKDMSLSILERKSIVISTQVINEFIWVMNRKYAVNIEQLKVLADRFWQKFEVALIKEVSISKALSIVKNHNYAYWDSLILAVALEKNCSILYSEDMQDGQVIEERIRIINPFK
ncbi:MAG: PIN domain-containing protein [Dethiobacter sp.]|nr:PIN domain-containing protein [Dethiobacter sp.]MCL5982084.1 PIN domain-containing protein [Bacillota bacterium]